MVRVVKTFWICYKLSHQLLCVNQGILLANPILRQPLKEHGPLLLQSETHGDVFPEIGYISDALTVHPEKLILDSQLGDCLLILLHLLLFLHVTHLFKGLQVAEVRGLE